MTTDTMGAPAVAGRSVFGLIEDLAVKERDLA
jgi:hypothetical protein